MADQKESSVLFSLRELMNLEETRIREEEAEKERRARAESDARAATEKLARENEEKRLREEEEVRRADEQRKREDETRLEAIRAAELEKARAEAEHRARLDAMKAQQAHEQQLAVLRTDKSKKQLKLTVGVIAGTLVLGAVGAISYINKQNVQRIEAERVAEEERRVHERELLALKAKTEEADQRVNKLMAELSSAKDEASKAALTKKLQEAQNDAAEARRNVGASRPSGGGSNPPAAKPAKKSTSSNCNCTPGDPLCSCL